MAPSRPQDGPEWPQQGPSWLQQAPRWPQDGPRWPQNTPKLVYLTSGRSVSGPKSALRAPKMAPRGPRMAPRWPRKAARGPRMALRGPFFGSRHRLAKGFANRCRAISETQSGHALCVPSEGVKFRPRFGPPCGGHFPIMNQTTTCSATQPEKGRVEQSLTTTHMARHAHQTGIDDIQKADT